MHHPYLLIKVLPAIDHHGADKLLAASGSALFCTSLTDGCVLSTWRPEVVPIEVGEDNKFISRPDSASSAGV